MTRACEQNDAGENKAYCEDVESLAEQSDRVHVLENDKLIASHRD